MEQNLARFSKLFDLSGRVAVVTGAAQGNGGAIAQALADAGAKVVQTDIAFPAHSIQAGVQKIMDVTDEAQVTAVFAEIAQELGGLDILVNNAGIIYKNPVDQLEMDAFGKVMDINLNGTVICTKHAVPYMKRRGWGRVVNISSSQAFLRTPVYSAYAASKSAISHLTRIWGNELAEFGILVNALCPSYVMTPMMENSIKKRAAELGTDEAGAVAAYVSDIPLKRILEVEEVANWTVALCGELAASTTGNNFSITGGQVQL